MMGVTIGLETSTGEQPPHWFNHSDSTQLHQQLVELGWNSTGEPLPVIARHLGLDLAPLTRVAYELEEFDSFMARDPQPERAAAWEADRARNEAAWQPPQVLLAPVQALRAALLARPGLFAELAITDPYFTDGFFAYDLADLESMLTWAVGRGIPRVRLFAG